MERNQPMISVIVPIYNAGEYIERCVRSLFEQTLSFIEYIFVDDCSFDNSIDIIKSVLKDYPERKEESFFIRLEKNSGPASARNKGLEYAIGEYIYFCDADDWLDLSMLEQMYIVAKEQEAEVVISDFYIVYHDRNEAIKAFSFSVDKVASLREYIKSDWNFVWNLLVKRNLYDRYDIRFIPNFMFCEDMNLSVKLFHKAKKIINIHRPLYYYNRLNETSITHRINDKCLFDCRIMCLDLIEWCKIEGIYECYADLLYWKILNTKQEWLLDSSSYEKFIRTIPESNHYILSCPYLNVKLKIMGWCLVHHLKFVSLCFLFIRKLKKQICNNT